MYNPIQIANYFINKSFETGDLLTPMKLLKLVYIAHGWNLGITSKPLINEVTEAWKYGPVVPSVYYAFKNYGDNNITSMLNTSSGSDIDDDTKKLLDKVMLAYKNHNGLQLSTLTHQIGTPWYIVWHEMGAKASQSIPIPNNLIKEHYLAKVNKNKNTHNA